MPTWSGWTRGRAAGSSFKASGKCPGELFGAHAGCLPLEMLHHPQLFTGEPVTVSGERALEILPRLSKELGVFRGPARQVPHHVLAQDPSTLVNGTDIITASVYREPVLQAYPKAFERSDAERKLGVLTYVHGEERVLGCAPAERYYAVSGLRIVRPAIESGRVMDGVPDDIAERRYERWVMRAVELVYGNYPDNKVEAERVLLLRMQDSLVGNVSPTDSSGEGASTPEEVGAYSSDYGKDRLQDIRSLVAALYSAAGGDEWALNIKLNNDASTFARVSGTSLESSHQRVDISVDVRSLACEDADDLRTLHERIARELPRREVSVEESANQALEAVEEIQGVLERVREISDALDTQEEMRNVRVALDNLWMVLAGIAAAEEDRRSRGGANRQT